MKRTCKALADRRNTVTASTSRRGVESVHPGPSEGRRSARRGSLPLTLGKGQTLTLGKGQTLQTKRYLLILVSLGLCAPAAAAPITVPTSLNPGDEYRLAFVTSDQRNGASSLITSYNAFVTGVANIQPALTSLGTTWKAIGSTATVDARDNTGTNPVVDGVGVPIFLLNDTLLANDNLDLWDGSILVPFEIDEGGSAIQQSFVWTGTSSSGVST